MRSPATIHAHIGLRGLAATGVIFVHLADPWRPAHAVLPRGYLLVDLFFMLSGFIMAYKYRDAFAAEGMRARAWPFMKARLIRIVPLHVAVLLAMAAAPIGFALVHRLSGRPTVFDVPIDADWLRQLVFVNVWAMHPPLRWNFPDWSIAAEVHLYLLFPLLVTLLIRGNRVAGWALLVTAAAIYAGLATAADGIDQIGWLAIPRAGAGFLIGMVLERLRPAAGAVSTAWLSGVQLAALGGVLTLLAWPLGALPIIPPLAILVLATSTDRGVFARACGTRPLAWLGDRSFAVYLLHMPILLALGQVWVRIGDHSPAAGLILIAAELALVLAAATLSGRWIEGPTSRWLRARAGLRRAPLRESPAAP